MTNEQLRSAYVSALTLATRLLLVAEESLAGQTQPSFTEAELIFSQNGIDAERSVWSFTFLAAHLAVFDIVSTAAKVGWAKLRQAWSFANSETVNKAGHLLADLPNFIGKAYDTKLQASGNDCVTASQAWRIFDKAADQLAMGNDYVVSLGGGNGRVTAVFLDALLRSLYSRFPVATVNGLLKFDNVGQSAQTMLNELQPKLQAEYALWQVQVSQPGDESYGIDESYELDGEVGYSYTIDEITGEWVCHEEPYLK